MFSKIVSNLDRIISSVTATKAFLNWSNMATKSPVVYWEKKRKGHNCWAILIFGVLTAIVITIVCMGEENIVAVNTFAKMANLSPTMTIAAYATLVTLIFWFIRLLTRLFLSHIHLGNDAAEKVTMSKAYLALLRNKSFNEDSKTHIEIILSALFRSSGDGIVKDDEIQVTVLEWLSKFIKKG